MGRLKNIIPGIGQIFSASEGAKDAVNAVAKLTDDVVYTKEEKQKAFGDLLDKYAPFKLAQRYLAIMFTGTYLGIITLTALSQLVFIWIDKDPKLLYEVYKWMNELLFYIVLTIMAFYFTGGVLDGGLKRFAKGKPGIKQPTKSDERRDRREERRAQRDES